MKLFVKNINFQTTTDELKQLFEIFGEVERVDIPLDKRIKLPKGYAFVKFKESDAAENALSKLDNTLFGGRDLIVTKAKK